jgi:5-hydroxyisourate hydrolase-like protein (transthyretin family)
MILSFFNHAFFQFLMSKKLIIKFSYLSIITLSLLVFGCDKIQDGIVDTRTIDYKVVSIIAPASYSTTTSDSSITTSVQIQNISTVGNVWCSIESLDETQSIYKRIDMLDDGNKQTDGDQTKGDGIYSCKFVMSKKLSNGKYQIQYFVEDNIRLSPDNLVKIGAQIFIYDNGQTNYPPVISNLILPNSSTRGTSFVFSIKVDDPNGASDVQSVIYRLYKPDGTKMVNSQGISEFPLSDDGNTLVDGDQTANDGIYSMILTIPTSYPAGIWLFEFQAKDKSGVLSNQLTANITVN